LKVNAQSSDGHLVLRVYAQKIEGHPTYEIHVHPESRHWFAHVERAGSSYAAELGYYSALGKWMRIAVSSGTMTPPDAASSETDTEFATIPFEFPFAKLMQIIEQAVAENLPLAQAIEELRRHGHPDLPRVNGTPLSTWTPQQEKALARIVSIDETRRVWMGSLEITEFIAGRFAVRRAAIRRVQRVESVRRNGKGERILVQRQCGADHLWRDRAGRKSHLGRTRNQTAF
jgi:hypothetical protein